MVLLCLEAQTTGYRSELFVVYLFLPPSEFDPSASIRVHLRIPNFPTFARIASYKNRRMTCRASPKSGSRDGFGLFMFCTDAKSLRPPDLGSTKRLVDPVWNPNRSQANGYALVARTARLGRFFALSPSPLSFHGAHRPSTPQKYTHPRNSLLGCFLVPLPFCCSPSGGLG